MKPTVGRIVHYQSFGTPKGEYLSKPIAAIVTQVHEETLAGDTSNGLTDGDVGLAILNPTGLFFNPKVPFSPAPRPGHWNWPPRE